MDYSDIEALAAVLGESATLTELEVRQDGVRLRLRRPAPSPKPRPRPKTIDTPSPGVNGVGTLTTSDETLLPKTTAVTAGYVGVFQMNRKAPVSIGDPVSLNQVLGQIETMRLLNDCIAPVAGRLQAILVMDGQPVEYGQPLFEIAPEEK